MPHSEFVHLHLHTQYSLLDGACRIPEILAIAKSFKMDSLAITDHGNMFGAIDFYLEAQKVGIKPIIGCEFYIAPQSRLEKSGGIEDAANHLILLARDEEGYRNLMKLVSISYREGFYYRPRIDKEVLAQYSAGLIGSSACLKGEVAGLILQKRFNDALKAADTYQFILGKGNFYLEIQGNSIAEQKIVNTGLIKISRELGIPLVATNDVHYPTKDRAAAHEALLCIQTQTTLDDPKHMRFQTDEFYFTSPAEMKQLFSECPEALKNTLEIASRCNLELDFKQMHLPKYSPPGGKDKEDFLLELCAKGLTEKNIKNDSEVQKRLDHELKIIKHMGFISYFLIVWDFIAYAKSQSIPVGPGRGSAAGSLVSYLLGITDLNPLNYGLLFERFLNPERMGLPDIDIDFCYERRQEVIDYVTNKYGQDNVAQIITFGTMQARAVIRDVGRVMAIAYAEVDRIAKLIPAELDITLKKALESEPELNNLYKNDPQITKLINIALSLEGLNRHASVHAAGVIISDKPLSNYMPVFKTADGQITTGYSMGTLEKIGLLKVDFLGLRTLTVIDETLKLIKKIRGVDIEIEKLPLDDQNTYKLLASSHTIGIFQVESSGMRDLLKKLIPERFEDLIALLALYRPGPIGSGMLDDFMKRKHGTVPIRYEHPKLESILKETYGIMVYQEQIMQIASTLAGFSLAQADILRKAMGKKIPEVMEKERHNFLSGCIKNGIKESTASKIFDLIEYFSGYGFNKCVIGSTKIINADTGNMITIEELFVNRKSVKTTLGCNDNLKIVKTKIKDVIYNGIKPVYKLKTALGREIIATTNHPMFTISGWKNLGDLVVGERIGLCRTLPIETKSKLEKYKIIVLAGIISEGGTCHPSGIYFYNNGIALINDFVKNVKKFKNTVPTISQRDGRFEVYAGTGKDNKFLKDASPWNKGYVKESYSTALKAMPNMKSGARLYIESLGLDHKKSTEKFIPEGIFSLDNAQLALFIGRLWSGDGFLFNQNNSIPFYATSSFKLCQQLQDLLLRLGITSKLKRKIFKYAYKNVTTPKTGYTLYLFGYESIKLFIQRVCPFIIGKNKQFKKLSNYYNSVSSDMESKDTIPPEVREIVKLEKEKLGLAWREIEKKSGVSIKEFCGKNKAHKKGFRRQTIMRLAQFFKSRQLLKLVEADVTWDRILSIEYAGKEKTYDLEIKEIHNFIANGIIVHNSHSTAYALISYRTAYLKANYPVEFMTALLTSERDNTDKIVEYVNESTRMGLKVQPPDINESEALFKVEDESTIRFGLLAIKNVGRGAAESIVKQREQGKFKSLEDLCQHVDLRLANRKVLESLIKCGALDYFGLKRAAMFANLDTILAGAQRIQKEKASGQFSFFDQIINTCGFDKITNNSIDCKEWPEPELLGFEKDMLGFYVSGHPLARYANQLKRFVSCSTSNLYEHKDQDAIKIVGLIVKIKQTVTRVKKEKMAILKLEDLDGAVEILVFPRAFAKISSHIQVNTIVHIRGVLDLKEETPKIIAEDLFPFEEIYKLITAININLSGIRENIFESLKTLLEAHRGQTPVYLQLNTPAKSRVQLIVGEGLYVTPSEGLIQDLDELLGEEHLSLVI